MQSQSKYNISTSTLVIMDFDKICRVVDSLTEKDNILQVYSREIMTILGRIHLSKSRLASQCRCTTSDGLVAEGFSPSEAFFLMGWQDLIKRWSFTYGGCSTEQQFVILHKCLNDVRINDNRGLIRCGLWKLVSIYLLSDGINAMYHECSARDCTWDFIPQVINVKTTLSNAHSLKDLCYKKCVVSGVRLDNEYTVFTENSKCRWNHDDTIRPRTYDSHICDNEDIDDESEDDYDSSYSSEDEEWIWTDEE
jgi:hypothetical protein